MSFFKLTDTTPKEPKVSHSDFEEYYPGINKNKAWKSLSPYIAQAEEIYIKSVLGDAYYNELEQEYQKDEIENPIEQENWQATGGLNFQAPDGRTWIVGGDNTKWLLLQLVRTASAYYTMYHAYPHLAVRVGDAGVQESNTEKTFPVRQWLYNSTRKEICFAAYWYIDKAVAFIKQAIADGSTDFDTYKNSDAYTEAKELFVDSPEEFNKYFNINKSAKAYNTLIPYIRSTERLYLNPLLGDDFVTELRTAFKANTLSTDQNNLLEKLKPWLITNTILEATPEVNLINEGNGWMIVESTDGIVTNKVAHTEMLKMICAKAQTNAAHYKQQLEAYLYKNLDLFPTFKDSDYNKDKNYDPNAYDKDEDPYYVSGGVML